MNDVLYLAFCEAIQLVYYRIGLSPTNPTMNTDISWCKEAHTLRWAFLFSLQISPEIPGFGALFAGIHELAHRRHFDVRGWQKKVPRRTQKYTYLQRLLCNRAMMHPPFKRRKNHGAVALVAEPVGRLVN